MTALLLVGAGSEYYRDYVLEGIARTADVVLVDPDPTTWAARYAVASAVADPADPAALTAAAADLIARRPVDGVVTYEEGYLCAAAELAERLGLPSLSADAAAVCRDKLAQRHRFAAHGVPSARFSAVTSVAEALDAAAEIGYPVVLKPRSLSGSVGVTVAAGPDELRAAVALAERTSVPGLGDGGGLLVEEFLDGPQFGIDCAVRDGVVEVLSVNATLVGFEPYCLLTGHLVGDLLPPDVAADILDAVRAANLAVGVDRTISNTDVRLTVDGPRIQEINGRPAGNFIHQLNKLATGLDVGENLARVATGLPTATTHSQGQLAGLRFIFPPHDMRLSEVDMAAGMRSRPWLRDFTVTGRIGDEYRLPPRGFHSRVGHVVAVAEREDQLCRRLDEAVAAVRVRGFANGHTDVQPEPLHASGAKKESG